MKPKRKANLTESTIYLCSPVNALVEGICEENVHLAEVLKHGDFGLGAFDDLDGEMVILDGCIYRIFSDGHVTKVEEKALTPFAAVTFYNPVRYDEIKHELSYDAFIKCINGLFLSPNLFYAVRIEGEFVYIKARSVPKQANYPCLNVFCVKHVLAFN